MTNVTNTSDLTVYIAVATGSELNQALRAALELAIQLKSGLHGLFLVDQGLSDLTGSGYTIEISGAMPERLLDNDQLKRSIRAWSQGIRGRIEKEAAKHEINCSFLTVSGDYFSAIAITPPESTLVLAHPRHFLLGMSNPAIYVIDDGSPLAERAMNMAINFASRNKSQIQRIRFIDPAHRKNRTINDGREGVIKLEYHEFDATETMPEDFISFLRRHPASLMLIPVSAEFCKKQSSLMQLQSMLTCPLVVVF